MAKGSTGTLAYYEPWGNVVVYYGASGLNELGNAISGADSFVELLRNELFVINMSDYSGFEKVGSLGINLPASNSSITAI